MRSQLLFLATLVASAALCPPPIAAQSTTCGTLTVDSASPVTIPLSVVLHKGDFVDMTVTLSSSDPNESGENEPLAVAEVFGGQSFVIPTYESYVPLHFDITTDGELLTASILGADGDEQGTIEYCANQTKLYPQSTKDALINSADNSDALGFALDQACLSLPEAPICELIAKFVDAPLALYSLWANEIASDPADTNFTKIALPVFPSQPPASAGNGVTQQEADALNSVFTNLAQSIGYAQATYTSLNRAQGALNAGSTTWEAQQLKAATSYSNSLGTLQGSLPSLLTSLQPALSQGGFPNVSVSLQDALNWESNVAFTGLPTDLSQALTILGANSTVLTQITSRAVVQDITTMAGTYPAQITNTNLITSLQQAALQLQAVYAFSGFLPPLNNATFSHGRTIPVKFALSDGSGAAVTTAVAQLSVSQVQTDGSFLAVEVVSSGASNLGNLFRPGSPYVYNLNTKTYVAGNYVLRVVLDNGTNYSIQITLQ
jgi:hypothetical protein